MTTTMTNLLRKAALAGVALSTLGAAFLTATPAEAQYYYGPPRGYHRYHRPPPPFFYHHRQRYWNHGRWYWR